MNITHICYEKTKKYTLESVEKKTHTQSYKSPIGQQAAAWVLRAPIVERKARFGTLGEAAVPRLDIGSGNRGGGNRGGGGGGGGSGLPIPWDPPVGTKKTNSGPQRWTTDVAPFFSNVSYEPESQMFAIEMPVRLSSRALR